MRATLVLFLGVTAIANASDAIDPAQNPTGTVTLEQSLALAIEHSPRMRIFAWDMRAAEAREIQAKLRPNPELSIEIEGLRFNEGPESTTRSRGISGGLEPGEFTLPFAGEDITVPFRSPRVAPEFTRTRESGTESGLRESEITVGLSQLIELGGKRAKRIELAQRAREVAAWDYEVVRADVLAETAKAFYAVVAAQEQLRLAEELGALARQTVETVKARVDAGKVSAIELSTAEVELGAVLLDVERVRHQLDISRISLAACWGASVAEFESAAGVLGKPEPLPSLESLREEIALLPDLARWVAELSQREAAIAAERANARPDLTVFAGLRSTGIGSRGEEQLGISGDGGIGYSRSSVAPRDSREHSLTLEASIPLPLFNRNQGRVREEEHLAAKAAEERRAAEVNALTALGIAHRGAVAAHREVDALTTEILPKSEEAFRATSEGYRQGKFDLLSVLVAERTLFDARSRRLDALARYFELAVDVERLSGKPLAVPSRPTAEVEP